MDLFAAAREAVEQGRWTDALDALDDIGESGDAAVRLHLRSQAAYGAGELEAAVEALEQLHRLEHDRGDEVQAAAAAAMIAMYLMMDTGLMSPVRGWLRTAERLLAGSERTPAHALVAMTRTYERFMCGDMAASGEHAAWAIELGEETGVVPAVVIGRVASARIRIFDGDVDGGLAQLDEIGAFLMSGGADPLTTGMMYCELICAAQGLALYDMACEWTDVMEHWRHGAAFGGINGRCRVHRAELLRVSGTCDAAEAEALGACDELRPWMRREFGWPLVELGNVRLRRGDLAGAEEAYLDAHQHGWSPQPGLALVRLEQGDASTAATMIDDAIQHPFDIPSKERPPFGDLRLAPLYDAQSEIAAACGDAATVAAAAERLAAIADRYRGPFLRAWADLAAARAALVHGAPSDAIEAAMRATNGWVEIGAPYEAATARTVLADAYEAAGRPESAQLEWDAAATTFRTFGAVRRADAAAERARGRVRPVVPVDDRVGHDVVFWSDGIHRTVGFPGETVVVKDLKGLRYLARLLAEPGREFHVLDLVAADGGVLRPDAAHPDAGPVARGGEAGIPMLDDVAKEAYRRRLAEIDDDIDDAHRMNDPARAHLAERDREYLIGELRRAIGLGGRSRTVGASAERARTSVARSIRYGLDQLAEVSPTIAARLRRSVRTGTYCVYETDPVAPLRWQLDRPPTPSGAPEATR